MLSYYQNWVNQLMKEYALEDHWIPCTSVICGILACKTVYDCSKFIISPICFKTYSSLPKMKQTEWDNRVISTVHGIVMMALSIYLSFWSDLYADDQQRGLVIFQTLTTQPEPVTLPYGAIY